MTGVDKIGVLCGGPSPEREISLRSGQAVHQALRSAGIPSALLPLSEKREEIPKQIQAARIAAAFIALHGEYGEDGTIQSLLEGLRIPYTGSGVESCRYGMDKVHSRRRWLAASLPVPEWRLADAASAGALAQQMKLPFIVKPRSGGSSLGVGIVDSLEKLPEAVEKAAAYGREFLLEEYLPGPELTVGILQDQPLPVIQVVPKRRFYDYTAKYTPGLTEYLVPAPVAESVRAAVQELAQSAHETLGCRSFSRVDLILAEGKRPVLLELNPIPGLTESSLLPKAAAAAGILFPELCRRMLASAVTAPALVPR